MKKFTYLLFLTLWISACGKSKPTSDNTPDLDSIKDKIVESNYPLDSLLGEYIGGFGKNTIIISVNYATGKNASGYNILKGNRRNIKGEFQNMGDRFHFVLKEPGGDPFDGIFTFDIDTTTKTMKGEWAPFDSTKTESKKFSLTKRIFDHGASKGYVGFWYLFDLKVEFKADKSGLAEGYFWNEKTESGEDVKIPFSWFEQNKSVKIEWARNNIFLSSTMEFKYEKNTYEEMLISGDYIMYRY